jgi:7-carboxy-7-deazaguanine synthase
MKRYSVHSVFKTIQGEGFHAGTVCVMARLVGCNVWSGHEKDRQRDSAKSRCALFCDTEFAKPNPAMGGGVFTAEELVERVSALWTGPTVMHVVFTGGEPSLQVDPALVRTFREQRPCYVQMETNGSNPVFDDGAGGVDWVTVSPKPPLPLHPECLADELKVLWPDMYSPELERRRAEHRFLQVIDRPGSDVKELIEFLYKNPQWRLSHQLHKTLNIP